MTVFEEMRPPGIVNLPWDVRELDRMLSQSIERGYVREIPVAQAPKVPLTEAQVRWFLELDSGEVLN
jgi:hypothetical protein